MDDFESYTDQTGQEVFSTRIDGCTNGLSGSTVGNITAANVTYGETTIIRGGTQSMPIDHNNIKSPFYREAEREFSPPQDWTAEGVNTLMLYVHGRAGNAAAPLYVAVEDSTRHVGVVTHSDAAITGATEWTQWKVPPSSFTSFSMTKNQGLPPQDAGTRKWSVNRQNS